MFHDDRNAALREGGIRMHVSGLHGMLCFELRLNGESEYRERFADTSFAKTPGVVVEGPLEDAISTRLRRLFERAFEEAQARMDLDRDPIRLMREITLVRRRGGKLETENRWVIAGRDDADHPPALVALLRFCEQRIEALPKAPMPGGTPEVPEAASQEGTGVRPIPGRQDLERRLSHDERHALDGSFASLWALEHVVSALRIVPDLQAKAGWIAPYLADLFERAFREMKMTVERPSPTRVCTTAPVPYEVDVAADLVRLYGEPGGFVAFHDVTWATDRVAGCACIPGYGLGTIFQSHPWAKTVHSRILKQPDRIERGLSWLATEQASGLGVGPGQQALAEAVVSALSWPPLGFTDNTNGTQNRTQAAAVLQAADANAAREVTDALVAGGDDGLRWMGAAVAIGSAVPPDTEDEGQAYKTAAKMFGIGGVPPFIERSIASLTTPKGPTLEGIDALAYVEMYRFHRQPQRALPRARALAEAQPNIAAYRMMFGWYSEMLGDLATAMREYDAALALEPRYGQARINRGSQHGMAGRYGESDADFFAAREIDPYSPELRRNLVLNHFFALPKEEAALAEKAAVREDSAPQKRAAAPRDETLPKTPLRERFGRPRSTQNEIDGLLRALVEHDSFVLPDSSVGRSWKRSDGPYELRVFTDEAAHRRALAHDATLAATHIRPGAYWMQLVTFGRHSAIVIDGGDKRGGMTIGPDQFRIVRAFGQGAVLERVGAGGYTPQFVGEFSTIDLLFVAQKGADQAKRTAADGRVLLDIAATPDLAFQGGAALGDGFVVKGVTPIELVRFLDVRSSPYQGLYLLGPGVELPLRSLDVARRLVMVGDY